MTRLFPLAVYVGWAALLAALAARRHRRLLNLLAVSTILGGPGELAGGNIGAFAYARPTLPDRLYGGVAPYWAPFGWGAALTGLWILGEALRRRLRLPETFVFQVMTTLCCSFVTILPGEALAVRLGIWRWTHPERLPLTFFHRGLGIPLGAFIPPALISVFLGRHTQSGGR